MSDFFETWLEGAGNGWIASVLGAVVLCVICVIVIRIVSRLLKGILEKSGQDPTVQGFILTAVKVVLWFLAAVIIAESVGIPTASFVALLSVAGLALSLSVQNLLANLFSGVTLLFTKPFKADDFVAIGDKQGEVQSLGLFYTVIKTPDERIISIPNSEVAGTAVINYSSHKLRRVDMTFCASYDCETADVRNAIMDAVAMDSRIAADPAPVVYVGEYKDSCISYTTRVYCDAAVYWDVYFAMNENVRECFKAHDVTMSYNHLNVHLDK